jgi:hypothetical protein
MHCNGPGCPNNEFASIVALRVGLARDARVTHVSHRVTTDLCGTANNCLNLLNHPTAVRTITLPIVEHAVIFVPRSVLNMSLKRAETVGNGIWDNDNKL